MSDKNDKVKLLREFLESFPENPMPIAAAVKRMRKISGLNQAEFAKHRDISLASLRMIEQGVGNPSVKTLNKIAEVFGMEIGFTRKSSKTS